MSNINSAIMDAAETRMRAGGFEGFSFRDIAADVGVKSSSVHYHFPTKEKLAAAVVRRYSDRAILHFDRNLAAGLDPVGAWTQAFKSTLLSKGQMCPCIVLGAGARDLPKDVADEVRRFFAMNVEKLQAAGLSETAAAQLLATVTGAMVLANALDDNSVFDRATHELTAQRA